MAQTIAGMEPLLDVNQAAQILGITPRTLQEWVRLRKLPFLKIGKLTKFRPEALQAWISAQEVRVLAGSGRE
jgi:excisionase family DNA binding protein